ncbi:MAG: hypothetical protein ACI823_000684 [Chitinophagales bacterium]
MKACGRQHLLVVEGRSDGNQVITGLFSSTQIEKKLQVKILLSQRANNFAKIQRALA